MHVCRAQAVVADWKRFVVRNRNLCCHRQIARPSPVRSVALFPVRSMVLSLLGAWLSRFGAWLSPVRSLALPVWSLALSG